MDDGGPRGRRDALLARLHVRGAGRVDALARELRASPRVLVDAPVPDAWRARLVAFGAELVEVDPSGCSGGEAGHA